MLERLLGIIVPVFAVIALGWLWGRRAKPDMTVVNRLSMMWATPAELPAFFRELMLSSRPGREGFAFEVLTELADLQSMMELMLEKGRRR